jgi:hypothetical protein
MSQPIICTLQELCMESGDTPLEMMGDLSQLMEMGLCQRVGIGEYAIDRRAFGPDM